MRRAQVGVRPGDVLLQVVGEGGVEALLQDGRAALVARDHQRGADVVQRVDLGVDVAERAGQLDGPVSPLLRALGVVGEHAAAGPCCCRPWRAPCRPGAATGSRRPPARSARPRRCAAGTRTRRDSQRRADPVRSASPLARRSASSAAAGIGRLRQLPGEVALVGQPFQQVGAPRVVQEMPPPQGGAVVLAPLPGGRRGRRRASRPAARGRSRSGRRPRRRHGARAAGRPASREARIAS